jgi:predicted secreted protein
MAGIASKGTILKRATVAIGDITTLGGPNTTAATIDVTTHDSTWMEYVSGMKDGGEVSFDINFRATESQQAVRDDLGSAPAAYVIEFPTGAGSVAFSAIVTAFGPTAGGVNDKLSASITLKVTGAVTWTDPA